MSRSPFTQKIYSYLRNAQQWYLATPERSLDEAYKAALVIKSIEDEHFNGKKIAPESANYGDSVMSYFQLELRKQLKTIRMRLTEFKATRSVFSNSNQSITKLAKNNGTTPVKDSFAIQTINTSSLILEKLRFIDEILAKYSANENTSLSVPSVIEPSPTIVDAAELTVKNFNKKPQSKAEETKVLPRSILGTINRIKTELDPKSEDEVVNKFRSSQKRTFVSVRLILLLIIVPFLTQQLSKHLIISPIVDHWRAGQDQIFLNSEMEERAFTEIQRFEERIKFESLISETGVVLPERAETNLKRKAQEIAEEFRAESANAVKNVFADILSVIAFAWVVLASKREIAILKDFLDQIVYGLSDSAKAFIIILFTDVFVGFHSPHGWEVLLSGVSRHLGIPENRDFIFLFIATFPVILDTVFKYWIFRYLNKISPSAVATYRNMNE